MTDNDLRNLCPTPQNWTAMDVETQFVRIVVNKSDYLITFAACSILQLPLKSLTCFACAYY